MPSFYVDNDNNFVLENMSYALDGSYINDAVCVLSVGDPDITGTITNATNATPIVITTSAAHGRTTGDTVLISHVEGNRAANGTWTITVLTSTTFSLNTSVGSGAYTTGGDWYLGLTGATSLGMSYVASSNGKYVAILPYTAQAIALEKYYAIVYVSNYGLQFERTYDALIRS